MSVLAPFKQTIVPLGNTSTVWTALPAEGTDYPAFFSALGCKGFNAHIDLEDTGTVSLTFTFKEYNILTGEANGTIIASAARTGDGGFTLNVYPGIAETANVSVSDVLSEYFMLDITGTIDTAKITVYIDLIP